MPITTPTAGLSFSSLWAVPTTLAILIRTTSIPRQLPLSCLRRWSPFAELLFGGRKVTYEVDNPELENKLLSEWNDGSGTLPHYPKRSDWSTQVASNGPSLAAGGGIDVIVTRPFAWRLINIQYIHSWMGGVDHNHPDNGFRITTEVVLRVGTW